MTLVLAALVLCPAGARPGCAADLEAGRDAVLLEESLDITIRSVDDARVRYLNRTRVLTPRGAEDFDEAPVFYEPGVAIREMRGAVISPEGKRVEVKKQQIADAAAFASFEMYADSRMRVMRFPGVVPGATVEYSYEEQVSNLLYMGRAFYLQEEIPVRLKTLTVAAPATFPIRLMVRDASPEYTREERDGLVVQTWRVRDVPAVPNESRMPPADDLRPRILIAPKRLVWDGHPIDADTWDGIARFQLDLSRDRQEPAPEVARTAREMTAGLSDPDEKLRRLYEFVQGKIDYVAIELGIGGYQPHPNGDVLAHRYGDCKDKATLLIAMLRAVGLEGDEVMIRTRDEGLIDADAPSITFNHAIVAVPRPDGYLFLDPTSEQTPFGDLPWQDQGVKVVVVRGDGRADFVETPLFAADHNRSERRVEAEIGPGGALQGTLSIAAWGQRRANLAPLLQARASEKEDALKEILSWLSPGARLQGQEVTAPARPSDPMRLTARFDVPGYVTRAGAIEVASPHVVRFPAFTGLAASPERRTPLFFPYLFSDVAEVRLRLPAGRGVKKLPQDRTLTGPGLKATSHYAMARDGERDVLLVQRTVSVERREIPAPEFPALREFAAALASEDATGVTLQSVD